jgi:hypothetical protein
MAIDTQIKPFTGGAFESLKNARVTYSQSTSGTFQSTETDQAWGRDTYVYSDKALRIVVSTGDDIAPTPPAGILIPNNTLIKLATLADIDEDIAITSVVNVLTIDAPVTGLAASDTIEQSSTTATITAVDEAEVSVTGGTLFVTGAAVAAMNRDVTITDITGTAVTLAEVPVGTAIGDTITQGVITATIEAIDALVLTVDDETGLTEAAAELDMARDIEIEGSVDQLVVTEAPVGIGAGDSIVQGAAQTDIISVTDDTYTVANNVGFSTGAAQVLRAGAVGWASDDGKLARVGFAVDLDSGAEPE